MVLAIEGALVACESLVVRCVYVMVPKESEMSERDMKWSVE